MYYQIVMLDEFKKMKSQKSSKLKIPQYLNLGTVFPCQYGDCILPLESQQVIFLSVSLSQTAVENGYFLVKEGTEECYLELQFALKPQKPLNLMIASFAKQLNQSQTFPGQLYIFEQNLLHKIQLSYRVEVPRISSKKLLKTQQNQNIYRMMINKSVMSQARIVLQNEEPYPLNLQLSFLFPVGIENKQSPFLLKIQNSSVKAQPKESIVMFISIETNIGYKKQFKGIKKCVIRNVLCLKTASELFYTLPLELILVFVKQPQYKKDD